MLCLEFIYFTKYIRNIVQESHVINVVRLALASLYFPVPSNTLLGYEKVPQSDCRLSFLCACSLFSSADCPSPVG